ncbi:hypothetical protein CDAR_237661 [Caerostris darwini]|uniref:Uncharacterized protein n=1 Tax=Caerostris darwini TaxID=1538125 RepID=A0AAV4NGR8_9ARAC|nr:hypothetical protein CDAR_237661 [Caerostris darwini]
MEFGGFRVVNLRGGSSYVKVAMSVQTFYIVVFGDVKKKSKVHRGGMVCLLASTWCPLERLLVTEQDTSSSLQPSCDYACYYQQAGFYWAARNR